MSRGFTLLEVVAAAVLLTMIVAAGLPLLRSARVDMQAAAASQTDLFELDAAVDDLLRQRPGLLAECLTQPAGHLVEWTSGGRAFSAMVRLQLTVLATDGERRTTHTWAVFSASSGECIRWIPVPTHSLNGGATP